MEGNMTMKSAALSLAVLVVAGTLGTTTSFTAKPTCCRAPHTCLSVHSASSSAAPAVWRWASRGRHGSCEVIPPPPALEDGPLCLESARRDRTNACAPHIALKTVEGSIEPQSSSGKTVVTKVQRRLFVFSYIERFFSLPTDTTVVLLYLSSIA